MQVRALRGRVVTPDHIIDDGVVVLSGSHIAWVGPADQAARAGFADAVEQAQAAPEGGYLLPGLVDVHCHGGGGESFPNAETAEQAMVSVLEHRRFGTTSLVASCVTAAPEVLRARTRVLAELCEDGELAGIHFEGPFVSVERCGAQDPTYIIDPDAALTRELIELGGGHVVTMTIAPEKPGITGDDGVNAALIEGGALPSFGHTDSEAAPVRAALAELLERKEVDPRVATEVLDRLEAAGVIDDTAYAARLARTRFAEKGTARRAIAEELRRKGLGERDVAEALEQISSEDEDSAALALARKKLSATGHLPWEVRRRRTAAVLGRKGYSRDVTMRAIAKALAEE